MPQKPVAFVYEAELTEQTRLHALQPQQIDGYPRDTFQIFSCSSYRRYLYLYCLLMKFLGFLLRRFPTLINLSKYFISQSLVKTKSYVNSVNDPCLSPNFFFTHQRSSTKFVLSQTGQNLYNLGPFQTGRGPKSSITACFFYNLNYLKK